MTAKPVIAPDEIKNFLHKQLTYPVKWTESVQNMISDGAQNFYEVGPGNVLTGLLKRIDRNFNCIPIGNIDQVNSLS